MEELTNVRRVISEQIEDAPHEALLMSTRRPARTALARPSPFSRRSPVDGTALTKLDGTAKGGIAFAIAGELGIPVKLIGIGEAPRVPAPVVRVS